MSSTIVNTLVGFGITEEHAGLIATDVAKTHDSLRAQMQAMSREIDKLMAEFHILEARAKAMEAALAEEGPHENIVPLHQTK